MNARQEVAILREQLKECNDKCNQYHHAYMDWLAEKKRLLSMACEMCESDTDCQVQEALGSWNVNTNKSYCSEWQAKGE